MKVIPGFGTLIYMACTDKPELGWDENGFANFTDLSKVPNFPSKQEEPGQHPAAPPSGGGQVPSARFSQISQAVPVVVSTPQVQFNVPAASL